jgi:DNA-binding transcriptional ArsR family regulator
MAYGDIIDALADPTRRSIFERLRTGPAAVGEIARDLPVSRPAVSQHLKVLKEAGLVSGRAEGTRRIYRVELAGLRQLRSYVESFWDGALDSFAQALERGTVPPGGKQ